MREKSDAFHVAFSKYHNELCLSRAKIALTVGILVVPFFSGLDYILARQFFIEFLTARLITIVEASIMLWFVVRSRPFGLRYSSLLVSLYGVTIGIALTYMCAKLGGFNSTYYVGIIIVILGATVVMPWHPSYHLFFAGGMYLAYLSQILFVGINAPWGTFINNNYFLFAAVSMTFVGSILHYRMHLLLNQKDEHKRIFFANVSHELKTPMTLVLTPLESASQEAEKGSEKIVLPKDTFETVRHNAYRLSGLISDLLDLTRSEIGKARISPEEIPNTREYFGRIFNSVTPLLESKGLQYEFAADGELAPHFFDKSKIDKVVVNLLSNALKFTPRGGKITMRVWDERVAGGRVRSEEEGELKIQVTDTGIGILADKVNQVFERFMQVDASSTRAYGGMGIGLSLVKDFIEQHGGTVEVTSEIGKGTTFTATLPRGQQHFKAAVVEATSPGDARGDVGKGIELPKVPILELIRDAKSDDSDIQAQELERPLEKSPSEAGLDTVLLVEDNAEIRKALRDVLKGKYRTIMAKDGVQGYETAKAHKPDLIISDVMMPRKDGYGLLADLKGDAELKETPVIMLTAKVGDENVAIGFQQGADDYITKPFQPKEVVSRVANLLRMRRQTEEIRRQRDDLEELNRQLKETEAELVQTEKLSTIGLLASGFAHEISNPAYAVTLNLGNIENLLQDLKGRGGAPEEVLERLAHHLKRSGQEINRIKETVKTFLLYSQKNREGVTRQDVMRDIESTLTLLRHAIDDAGAVVHCDKDGPISLEADHGALNQVFTNLVQNALHAGAKNIGIRAQAVNGTCQIKVTDDGGGIPPEALPRIFEPFFTTKEVGKGTGLGLNIAQRIIRSHQGTLSAVSEPGKGTEFTVVIPMSG